MRQKLVFVLFLCGALFEPNRLSAAPAISSVNWLPWSSETWTHAAAVGRPVFVHVARPGDPLTVETQRATFAHPAVESALSNDYTCVFVDAARSPGIAAALGAFVFETQQERGVPLNVWFTPTGLPVSGRTYLRTADEWGKPGLLSLLERISRRHTEDPAGLQAEAAGRLRRFLAPARAGPIDLAALNTDAVELLAITLSSPTPGGPAASTVLPTTWRYLVQQAAAGGSEAAFIWQVLANHAASPMRDPDSGLFFERVGHDSARPDFHLQAGAALAYVEAGATAPDPADATRFNAVAAQLLDWLAAHPQERAAAPLDAQAHALLALATGAARLDRPDLHAETTRTAHQLAEIITTTRPTSPRDVTASLAVLQYVAEHWPDEASGLASTLAILRAALPATLDNAGLATFAPGSALVAQPFADWREDGARPTAQAWLAAFDPASAGALGRTLAAGPDLFPALLWTLNDAAR